MTKTSMTTVEETLLFKDLTTAFKQNMSWFAFPAWKPYIRSMAIGCLNEWKLRQPSQATTATTTLPPFWENHIVANVKAIFTISRLFRDIATKSCSYWEPPSCALKTEGDRAARIVALYTRSVRVHVYRPLRRFLVRRVLVYMRNTRFRHGMVVVRDRASEKADMRISMSYLRHQSFWVTAFEGPFHREPDGSIIVRVHQMGTSQEAVQAYALYQRERRAGKDRVRQMMNACQAVDELTDLIQHLLVLGEMWDGATDDKTQTAPAFYEIVNDEIGAYIDTTLYRLEGRTSYQRLEDFLDKNPVMASYIWKANFSTPEERRTLGFAMQIASKNLGGFVKASSIGELRAWMRRKIASGRTVYDDLPQDMKKRITDAERALEKAKKGTPLPGGKCYISSDAIDAATNKYNDLWRTADRWVAKHRQKKVSC